MSPEDGRLVAALVLLASQLDAIIDEVTAGQFDQDERRELARVLCTIAAELEPPIILHDGPPGVVPLRLPFANSGPPGPPIRPCAE